MADSDTTQTRSDPAGEEAARVAAAAAGSEQPTVIVDDPDETGRAEGEEVVSGPPPTTEPEPDPDLEDEAAEDVEAPSSSSADVVSQALGLGDLSRPELERLNQAVENTLRGKGAEPGTQGPTLSEKASKVPVNEEATAKLTAASAAVVFKKDGVKPADITAMSVRQEVDMDGTASGPAYLRIVTRGGRKLTAVHE